MVGIVLERPFWCQKQHFKSKKWYYFCYKSLIVRRSPRSDPSSPRSCLLLVSVGIRPHHGFFPQNLIVRGHPDLGESSSRIHRAVRSNLNSVCWNLFSGFRLFAVAARQANTNDIYPYNSVRFSFFLRWESIFNARLRHTICLFKND